MFCMRIGSVKASLPTIYGFMLVSWKHGDPWFTFTKNVPKVYQMSANAIFTEILKVDGRKIVFTERGRFSE